MSLSCFSSTARGLLMTFAMTPPLPPQTLADGQPLVRRRPQTAVVIVVALRTVAADAGAVVVALLARLHLWHQHVPGFRTVPGRVALVAGDHAVTLVAEAGVLHPPVRQGSLPVARQRRHRVHGRLAALLDMAVRTAALEEDVLGDLLLEGGEE